MADIDLSLLTPRAIDPNDKVVVMKDGAPDEMGLIAVGDFATATQANATHTGDAAGDTALTLQPAAITGKATVTADGADYILISDTSDGGALKKALASDLAGGGSYTEPGPTRWYALDDMVTTGSSGVIIDTNWSISQAGTSSAQSLADAPDTGPGWVAFILGTTATGRTARATGTGSVRLGDGAARYGARFRLSNLSDATDNFTTRWGFIGSVTGNGANAAFVRYNHAVNGGNYQAVTRTNNTETAVDTGVTATVGVTVTLLIEVDPTIPQAVFKIDGTTVATITTNIPTEPTRYTGAGSSAVKSAGTTTKEIFLIDYQFAEQLLPGRT